MTVDREFLGRFPNEPSLTSHGSAIMSRVSPSPMTSCAAHHAIHPRIICFGCLVPAQIGGAVESHATHHEMSRIAAEEAMKAQARLRAKATATSLRELQRLMSILARQLLRNGIVKP